MAASSECHSHVVRFSRDAETLDVFYLYDVFKRFNVLYYADVFTARSELRKVLFSWRRQSVAVWLFCLYMKNLWNRCTDLRQIYTEHVFGLSLGRV